MKQTRTTNWLTTLVDAKAAPITAGLQSAQMMDVSWLVQGAVKPLWWSISI